MFGVSAWQLLFLLICFGTLVAAAVGVGVAIYYAVRNNGRGA